MASSIIVNPSPPISNVIQIGTIAPFGGSTIPSKQLACNGALIGRSGYADLFDTLGTIWGGGDGSTIFALPNLNGRTIIGVGESTATGHTAHSIGQLSGEEKHTLVTKELASHSHGCGNSSGSAYVTSGSWGSWAGVTTGGSGYVLTSSTSSTGSNTAHNIMQPYAACTYIIYTGVE